MHTPATKTSQQERNRSTHAAPERYIVTDAHGHQLVVRRPDGRPTRVRPSRRLVDAGPVQGIQSYLHIPAG